MLGNLLPSSSHFISDISSKNMDFVLVTNGIIFADNKFLYESISRGLKSISMSLKFYNEKLFVKRTGKELFNQSIIALKNIKNSSLISSFSFDMLL